MVEGLIWLIFTASGRIPLSIALERMTIKRFMLARVVPAAVVPRSAVEIHVEQDTSRGAVVHKLDPPSAVSEDGPLPGRIRFIAPR
jgi:hypothetical protein